MVKHSQNTFERETDTSTLLQGLRIHNLEINEGMYEQ